MSPHADSTTPLELSSAIIGDPLVVSPDTPVFAAIALMSSGCLRGANPGDLSSPSLEFEDGLLDGFYPETRLGCVVVVENEQVVGILTERDALRLSIQLQPLVDLTVQQVMSQPVITLRESACTDVWVVLNLLQRRHISYLPILDDQDRLRGLVTRGSVLQALKPLELFERAQGLEQTVKVLETEMDTLQQAIASQQLQEELSKQPQMEARLKAREGRFASLASAVPVGMFHADAHGKYLYVNEHWGQITGLSPEDAVGEGWRQALHVDDRDRLLREWLQAAQEERAFQLEYRCQHPDGAVRWVHCQAVPERDADGQFIGYVGALTDISDRKRTEAALEESEQRFRKLFESTPKIAVQGYNRHRQVIYWNKASEALYGYTKTEAIGQTLEDLIIPSEMRPQVAADVAAWLVEGRPIPASELSLMRKDGSRVMVFSSHLMLTNALGEPEMYCVDVDLNDLKQAETTLHSVIAGTAATTGQEFFPALVRHIAEALNVSHVLVMEPVNGMLRSIAFWANGALQPTFSCGLTAIPCERTLQDGAFYCEHSLPQRFPKAVELIEMGIESYLGIALCDTHGNALGALCVLNQRPIPDSQRAEQILRIFAARAAAELERKRANLLLEQLNQGLEAKVEERTKALAMMQSAVDLAAEGVFWVCRDGSLHYVNEAACHMVEYSRDELLSLTVFDIKLDCFPDCWPDHWQAIKQRRTFTLESQFQTKAGHSYPVEICVSYLELDGDEYNVAFVRDIRDRKQAEQALFQSEMKTRAILAIIPDLMLRVGSDGVYRESVTNRPEIELFFAGRDPVGLSMQEVLPPDLANRELGYIEQALRTGELQVYEQCLLVGGQWRFEEVRMVKSGEDEILLIVRDISDRKQAEQQLQQLNQVLEARVEERTATLQEREQFLKTVLDTFPLSVFWKDRNSVYLGCNRLFLRHAGLQSVSDIIGKTDDDMPWGDAEAEAYRADDREVMESAAAKLGIIETQRTADGKQIWIETNKIPLYDLDNQVIGVLGTYQDITARKQAEMQLQQTNQALARATRLKDEFLANMSHELRTPLNAILGMTEGLQEGIFGEISQAQLTALQTIERSGFHLLELINDILDVAKIEAGQIALDCQPTAIAPLCQSSLTFIKQQALKKRIRLEIHLPPHLPTVLLDERRIRQVLINLLDNAVKFTPEEGLVTLAVSHQPSPHVLDGADYSPQSCVRIAVRDTGIGIAADQMSKLFQPFIQIDSALNRQYTGTGLGLTLVKRIVDLHGGQVTVASQVGIGSCFTIELPCTTVSSSSPQPDPSSSNDIQPRLLKQKASPLILLAEDNEASANTISSYLRAKGYGLILAENGMEAISLVQNELPDLILMDIQMPGIDGLEAIWRIRRDLMLADVPIIALTAFAMAGDSERCLAVGANYYISKPIKLKQLDITIQRFLAS